MSILCGYGLNVILWSFLTWTVLTVGGNLASVMKIVRSRDVLGNEYDVSLAELSWRPAAYGVIIRDNQILLVKQRGKYHVPGGGVELGEMPEDAVIREVNEETGLIATNPRLVGQLSTFFTYSSSVHVQSLLLYYRCDVLDGELSVDGMEEDERAIGLMPEWVPLGGLGNLAVGSTVDWRPMVARALAKD